MMWHRTRILPPKISSSCLKENTNTLWSFYMGWVKMENLTWKLLSISQILALPLWIWRSCCPLHLLKQWLQKIIRRWHPGLILWVSQLLLKEKMPLRRISRRTFSKNNSSFLLITYSILSKKKPVYSKRIPAKFSSVAKTKERRSHLPHSLSLRERSLWEASSD